MTRDTNSDGRDFLYMRRLTGFRAFVNDFGQPGLHLVFANGDELSVEYSLQLLEALSKSLDAQRQRLPADPASPAPPAPEQPAS